MIERDPLYDEHLKDGAYRTLMMLIDLIGDSTYLEIPTHRMATYRCVGSHTIATHYRQLEQLGYIERRRVSYPHSAWNITLQFQCKEIPCVHSPAQIKPSPA